LAITEDETLSLTSLNHQDLNAYLGELLDAFKDGKITKPQALADLAQAISMAAIDDEEIASYIDVSNFRCRFGLT
jgi:hypothetical protein